MGATIEGVFNYPMDTALAKMTNERLRYDNQGEPALVARAQAGEYQAFEELVRLYRNDVFAVSFHFVHNREDAWDISQEVFVKAFKALNRFRGDASFKTWLLRIASNQCKDFLKKRRLKTVSFDETILAEAASATTDEPRQLLENKELAAAIQKALDGLSHKHRTAFILREYEGLSYEDMANVMECNLGTVMSRLHHARKKLQKSLRQQGVWGENGNE